MEITVKKILHVSFRFVILLGLLAGLTSWVTKEQVYALTTQVEVFGQIGTDDETHTTQTADSNESLTQENSLAQPKENQIELRLPQTGAQMNNWHFLGWLYLLLGFGWLLLSNNRHKQQKQKHSKIKSS